MNFLLLLFTRGPALRAGVLEEAPLAGLLTITMKKIKQKQNTITL